MKRGMGVVRKEEVGGGGRGVGWGRGGGGGGGGGGGSCNLTEFV